VFSYATYVQSTNQAVQNGKNEAISVVDLAVERLKDKMYYFNVDGVNEIIANLQYNPDFRNVYVLYPDGRIMTDGTKENLLYGQTSPRFTEKYGVAGIGQTMGKIVEIDSQNKLVCLLFPISMIEGSSPIGYIQADVSLEELKNIESSLAGTFAMVAILAASTTTGIMIFASRSIIEPVAKLRKAASKIAAGEYQHPIEGWQDQMGGTDEVRLLSHDLEMMRRQIAEVKDNLEQKVRERTVLLEKANEMLASLDRMKNEFISIASHEIRTPVQPILMFSELAQRGNIDPMTALRGISAEARRLKLLTDDILDVTKIEGMKINLDLKATDLYQLVESVVSSLAISNVKNNDVKLELEQIGQSDAAMCNVHCLIDSERVEQVLTNVIGNALKFTTKGSVKIHTSFLRHEYRFAIDVIDTGPGIPAEIMPRLFEKFATRNVAGVNKNGTGLGLYLSKALIEAHGGEIKAQNNAEGTGAIFSILLPASSPIPKNTVHALPAQGERTAIA
jgi:signal transduction histidine kinase